MQPLKFLAEKFELVRGGSTVNMPAMEGTRGLAVLLVFMVHFTTMMGPWIESGSRLAPLAVFLHEIGKTGVDLFFILSGYLIYGSLIARQQDFAPYFKRRIRRIYPVYSAVFLLYVVMSFVLASESRIPAGLTPAALYLLGNFLLLPGILGEVPMIAVSWTLSYEMLFYLVIPLLITGLKLRTRTVGFRVAFFAGVIAFIVTYSLMFGEHIRMIMFVAGIYLWELLQRPASFRPAPWLGIAGLLVGLAASVLPFEGHGSEQAKIGILFCGYFLFCYSCYATPQGTLARTFSWTPLRWLGNMSYSFYLLHGVSTKATIMVLAMLLPPAGNRSDWIFWAMLPLCLLASLLVSGAAYLAVERPYSLLPPDRKLQGAGKALQPASGQ